MDAAAGQTDQLKTSFRSRWLVGLLLATSLLIIMAVGAYFSFGRELFRRPFLVVAVAIAWLGALVGISIGSDPGSQPQALATQQDSKEG